MKHAKRLREWAIRKLGGYTIPNPFEPMHFETTTIHPQLIEASQLLSFEDTVLPYNSDENVKNRLAHGIGSQILNSGMFTFTKRQLSSEESYYRDYVYKMMVYVCKPPEGDGFSG